MVGIGRRWSVSQWERLDSLLLLHDIFAGIAQYFHSVLQSFVFAFQLLDFLLALLLLLREISHQMRNSIFQLLVLDLQLCNGRALVLLSYFGVGRCIRLVLFDLIVERVL